MAGWTIALLDVKGAVFNGRFYNKKKLYMGVPQGFKQFYPDYVCYYYSEQSMADSCFNFCWIGKLLMLWITWVDDCLKEGPTQLVENPKKEMMSLFGCEELGKMDEYVGCNIDHSCEECYIKLA
eukprot:2526398-Ditylum_brightwellii.AAC.1